MYITETICQYVNASNTILICSDTSCVICCCFCVHSSDILYIMLLCSSPPRDPLTISVSVLFTFCWCAFRLWHATRCRWHYYIHFYVVHSSILAKILSHLFHSWATHYRLFRSYYFIEWEIVFSTLNIKCCCFTFQLSLIWIVCQFVSKLTFSSRQIHVHHTNDQL